MVLTSGVSEELLLDFSVTLVLSSFCWVTVASSDWGVSLSSTFLFSWFSAWILTWLSYVAFLLSSLVEFIGILLEENWWSYINTPIEPTPIKTKNKRKYFK